MLFLWAFLALESILCLDTKHYLCVPGNTVKIVEGGRCVCVQGGSSAQRCGERREWVAESILILWIRPRFLPNEMTFISVHPIWVAKIFISILIDITAAANEARQDGKIYSGGACDVCVHRAWLFPSSPASVTVSFINVVTSLRPAPPPTWLFHLATITGLRSFCPQGQ